MSKGYTKENKDLTHVTLPDIQNRLIHAGWLTASDDIRHSNTSISPSGLR